MQTYTIANNLISATIAQTGAEPLSLIKDGTEYIWQGDPEHWEGHAPNCFPFETELTDSSYVYEGRRYEIASHGFMRKMRMKVDALTGESLVLSASDNKDTRLSYPFHFIFKIEYRLTGRTLTVTYTVANLGTDPMFFSIAGHPGFNLPLERAGSLEDYRLRFPEGMKPRRIATTEGGLLTGGNDEEFALDDDTSFALRESIFEDGSVLLSDTGGVVAVESDSFDRSIVISLVKMPYVCLWKRKGADFLCIEPWTSLPPMAERDQELEDMGLIYLRDGMDYSTSYSISCL